LRRWKSTLGGKPRGEKDTPLKSAQGIKHINDQKDHSDIIVAESMLSYAREAGKSTDLVV